MKLGTGLIRHQATVLLEQVFEQVPYEDLSRYYKTIMTYRGPKPPEQYIALKLTIPIVKAILEFKHFQDFRLCRICEIEKPLDQFPHGSWRCTKCVGIKNKSARKRHRDRKNYERDWGVYKGRRVLTLAEVLRITNLNYLTLQRWEEQGLFPKRVLFPPATIPLVWRNLNVKKKSHQGFYEDEITEWMHALARGPNGEDTPESVDRIVDRVKEHIAKTKLPPSLKRGLRLLDTPLEQRQFDDDDPEEKPKSPKPKPIELPPNAFSQNVKVRN